jgi:hypothetical protein
MNQEMNLFLLGAGFNADAKTEAGAIWGNSINHGIYPMDCGYPLVADTARLCFDLAEVPFGKSIEDLFAETLVVHNFKPLEKLSDRLMEADYRLATHLSSSGPNCYADFFKTFADAHFLTFNYDSLPEIFLHRDSRWFPEDGYGVPIKVEPSFGVSTSGQKSTSLVLHLHGSFCVFTTESELEPVPGKHRQWIIKHHEPRYGFDPDSISNCFPHYQRMMSPTGPVRIEERVIAPIPNKAEALQQPFIRETYDKACALVRQSGSIVSVGYSFNRHDCASYDPILKALSDSHGTKLIVVSPTAGDVARRFRTEYPRLRMKPVPKTMKVWAQNQFRLD